MFGYISNIRIAEIFLFSKKKIKNRKLFPIFYLIILFKEGGAGPSERVLAAKRVRQPSGP